MKIVFLKIKTKIRFTRLEKIKKMSILRRFLIELIIELLIMMEQTQVKNQNLNCKTITQVRTLCH